MQGSFHDALIHVSLPGPTFYWVTLSALFLNGFCAIARLKRLKEAHHLYWGMLIALLTLPFAGVAIWCLRGLAWLTVLDDSVQHTMQVLDISNGKPPRADWTPGHKIGVWLLKIFGYAGS